MQVKTKTERPSRMGSSLNWGPFRVLFIRVPYQIGDRKGTLI